MEVIESGIVVPSQETLKHHISLSNLDLLRREREHKPTIYFYRSPNGDSNFFKTDILKDALSKALVHFYPLAGRLEAGHDGRVFINCTGDGALFTVAKTELAADHFNGFTPSQELRQVLMPPVKSSEPPCMLLMVQVTFLKGGDVTLGIQLHHDASDGISSLHFLQVWSDIARGITDITTPPYFDRTIVRARSPPAVTTDHIEYKPRSTKLLTVPPFAIVILKLSKEQISTLKNYKRASTFRTISAHIWRCACIARQLEQDQETRIYTAVDVRSRLVPPLPEGFFGNGVVRALETAKVGEILASFDLAVEKLNQAIARVDDKHIRSVIDYVEIGDFDCRLSLANDVFVTSWVGLPIYSDFGWGKPDYMGRVRLFCAGVGYMLNSPGNDTGVTVIMGIETGNVERFEKAFYDGFNLSC